METKTAETFAELNLSDITLRALARLGYEKPSPIQAKVIPWALEGYDVIGQARTGTGKTASFAIPILEQLDPLELDTQWNDAYLHLLDQANDLLELGALARAEADDIADRSRPADANAKELDLAVVAADAPPNELPPDGTPDVLKFSDSRD